jgi:hypothetical protein
MSYGQVLTDLITTSDGVSSAGLYGFKNRIINGAMQIDQRNAGASVTVNSTASFFGVDRWLATGQSTDGVFTVQQSSTAPTGFKNSLLATVTTADSSIGSSQIYVIAQRIEGLNIADLAWGTANAATVTLSFWVRSSLTGTFGGSVTNETGYSYPFTYTISSANTFEKKTITITGPTSGTWLTTNGNGVYIGFTLGSGSTVNGTAGSWSANTYYGATGQTQVISTNSSTFYITGVQLEKGSTATSFDYRPYGTELALCQRYYQQFGAPVNRFFTNTTGSSGISVSTEYLRTDMRTSPSVSQITGTTATLTNVSANTSTTQTITFDGLTTSSYRFYPAAGMTTSVIYIVSGLANIQCSAEL